MNESLPTGGHLTGDPAEVTSVMDVIAAETDAFVRQDYAGWAACWVQDARTREICVSSSIGATVLEGWDQLSAYMRNVIESGMACRIVEIERRNLNVTISGDLAHVSFEEVSRHAGGRVEIALETRVLERAGGQWRILHASFVLRGHQQPDATRIAVDAKGMVVSLPPGARPLLESHPGLQISNGRLRATRPGWDKTLQAALKEAGAQHGYFQHYRYMTESGRAFRLPVVLGETDEGAVVVCVLTVRDGMTFVDTQSDGDVDTRLGVAKSVFGLSDGQMMLARHIVGGDSLKSAADSLGISINTARTHLSRIYAKTGINSQTALVRTLLSVG